MNAMRMSRQRLLVVAVVILMQVITVATVLMVQRGMAERAMLARANDSLSQSAKSSAADVQREVGRVRGDLDLLARQLEERVMPSFLINRERAGGELFLEMAYTLNANRDIEGVSFTGIDGHYAHMYRGRGRGVVAEYGPPGRIRRATVSINASGDPQFSAHVPIDIPDPRTSSTYRDAMKAGHRSWTITPKDGTTAIDSAAVIRMVGKPVAVVWVEMRPNPLATGLRGANPHNGDSGVLVDPARKLAWTDMGRIPSGAPSDLLDVVTSTGGAPRGQVVGEEVVATAPVGVKDLDWSVVLRTPRAVAVEGSGTTVGSIWVAVLVGVLAGFVILPVIVSTTRGMESLHTRATADGLTGLHNRGEFTRTADRLLARARRHRQPFTVAVLDLDGFKAINDGFGHGHGDESLRIFAQRLRSAARSGDVVGRLGGDEFVVALPGVAGDAAAQLLERMRQAGARDPIHVADATHQLDCTVGFSDATEGDVTTMIAQADSALIAGKATHKGRVYACTTPLAPADSDTYSQVP